MTHQPNQRQHDRSDAQYGRRPATMGTRTGSGTGHQPQFGGSIRQSGMGGQQMGGHGMNERPTGGQQMGGQRMSGQQTSGQQPHSFDDHMTDELWIALEDFSELSHVAAWCAARCATGEPELGICARVCQDLAEIAALNEMLIARDSMFGPEMADAFLRVAAEGVETLRQYQQRHPHILETVATTERTMNSCESLLQRVGGGSRGRQGSGTRTNRSQEMRGMSEQGRYGQGMSGQPMGGSEVTGQQY